MIDGQGGVVISCARSILLGGNVHTDNSSVRSGFKLAIGAGIDGIELDCGGSLEVGADATASQRKDDAKHSFSLELSLPKILTPRLGPKLLDLAI